MFEQANIFGLENFEDRVMGVMVYFLLIVMSGPNILAVSQAFEIFKNSTKLVVSFNIVMMFAGGLFRLFGFSQNLLTNWRLVICFISLSDVFFLVLV